MSTRCARGAGLTQSHKLAQLHRLKSLSPPQERRIRNKPEPEEGGVKKTEEPFSHLWTSDGKMWLKRRETCTSQESSVLQERMFQYL